MAYSSSIEWTDATWNPVRGCTKVSPGCKHCYAESIAERFRGVRDHPFEHGFDLRLIPEKLNDPLRWRSPRRVFVNSMSDLFHERIPAKFIARVGRVMQSASWHTYQVLTKRHIRMKSLLSDELEWMGAMPNVWFGVSVEDRRHGMPRVDALQSTSAVVRFLSIEPLLEDLGILDLTGIDWVIVGGESGPKSRPMNEAWVLSILRQCQNQSVPFFFKQWGGVNKKASGRRLLGTTYDALPIAI
jgi:protein gp37